MVCRNMVTGRQRKEKMSHKQQEDGTETKKKINYKIMVLGIKGTGLWTVNIKNISETTVIGSGDFYGQ